MIALLAGLAFSTVTLTPSDDVWVYPHSSSPGSETFLRVWGDGSSAVEATFMDDGGFSYAYLQWPTRELKVGVPKKATLTVFATAPEDLTAEKVKAAPLQAFGLSASFKEDAFMAGQTEVRPKGDSLGKATAGRKGDKWVLTIDLGESFREAVSKAQADGKPIGLALASAISPAESRSQLYKIYSKENPAEFRPALALEYGD